MSSSPSWFDQDKFTRIVKKVGPTKQPAAGPGAAAAAATLRNASREVKKPKETSTTRTALNRSSALAPSVKASQPIKLKATPPPEPASAPAPETVEDSAPETSAPEEAISGYPASIDPPEPRPVSPLSRRTTPLPDLKSLFEYEKPAAVPANKATSSIRATDLPDFTSDAPATGENETTLGPRQTESRDEIPAPDIDDRDASVETSASGNEEIDRLIQERDDARREAALLRERLLQGGEASPAAAAGSHDEYSRAIEDRDTARRDYASLREQFETLKAEYMRLRGSPGQKDTQLQQELNSLRAQLAEREEELNALKLDPIGADPEVDSLREEADVLHKQLTQAREESSIAQRGLALSQKALQETRDALREASDGSSQMRSSLESLKNECATLVQQNMLLQAQHDQLSREVATLKLKNPTQAQPSI